MMVPNGVYSKPDLCVDWFEGSVLTQPLAMRGLARITCLLSDLLSDKYCQAEQ